MSTITKENTNPQKWAILIGVNYYIPGNIRKPIRAKSLNGCVNDVEIVERYLIDRQHIDRQRIRKLTASIPPPGFPELPTEARELWPTYENMMMAFDHVTQTANPGDIVYIHYSGHGGRAVTIIPDIKTSDPQFKSRRGIDETLVPTDFNQGGRYLRDIELACLLQRMVKKDLHVTVILDSCHSGGMTRSHNNKLHGATIRNAVVSGMSGIVDGVDYKILATDYSDIPNIELRLVQETITWHSPVGSMMKLSPQGWVVIAACQPHEVATEMTIPSEGPNQRVHGVLTYAWVDSLLQAPKSVPYQALFRRTQAVMKKNLGNDNQTPTIMGNVERQMFLCTAAKVTHTIPVSHISGRRLHLSGGGAHGICEGDIFGIYSWDKSHIALSSPSLATAKVDIVKSTTAEAVMQLTEMDAVPHGSHAMLLRRSLPKITFHLVVMQCQDANNCGQSRLEQLKSHDLCGVLDINLEIRIAEQSTTHNNGKNHFTYYVTLNRDGQLMLYESQDCLRTDLPPSSTLESFLSLLNHLGFFYHYRSLQGPMKAPIDYSFEPVPGNFRYTPEKNLIEIAGGTSFNIRFRNNTSCFLYVSAFYFSSLRGIFRVYPKPTVGDYEEVDYSHARNVPIRVEYEPTSNRSFVVEMLKLFVTTKPTSFRTLENLGDLDPNSGEIELKSPEDGKQLHGLRRTLETFDSPHVLQRTKEVIAEQTPPRPMYPGDDETASTQSLQGGTGDAWQTNDITVHIYPPGTKLPIATTSVGESYRR